MIDRSSITAWGVEHPWPKKSSVEQDLVICRAIVSIFSDPILAKELAWRGGTALHKLYLMPQARYSEDIDLVRTGAGPVKPIIERLDEALKHAQVDVERVLQCWIRYMSVDGHQPPTCREFVENMDLKMASLDYLNDMVDILRPGVPFDPVSAYAFVRKAVIDLI